MSPSPPLMSWECHIHGCPVAVRLSFLLVQLRALWAAWVIGESTFRDPCSFSPWWVSYSEPAGCTILWGWSHPPSVAHWLCDL